MKHISKNKFNDNHSLNDSSALLPCELILCSECVRSEECVLRMNGVCDMDWQRERGRDGEVDTKSSWLIWICTPTRRIDSIVGLVSLLRIRHNFWNVDCPADFITDLNDLNLTMTKNGQMKKNTIKESFFRKWKQHFGIDKFYVLLDLLFIYLLFVLGLGITFTRFFSSFSCFETLVYSCGISKTLDFFLLFFEIKTQCVSFCFTYCLLVWIFWFHLIVELRSIVFLIDKISSTFSSFIIHFSFSYIFSSNISFKILQNLNNTIHIYTHFVWIIIVFFVLFSFNSIITLNFWLHFFCLLCA